MRKLRTIIIHCSASDEPKHDNVHTIEQWHRKRGFDGIGYHYYIDKDGLLFKGRDLEKVGAHAKGFNTGSVGICLGGLENFTQEQFNTCAGVIQTLIKKYGKLDVVPHRAVNPDKGCPVFDMMEIYRRLF